MNMDLIKRVESAAPSTNSKHSTQDPNERHRRQLLLTHCNSQKDKMRTETPTFSEILKETFNKEI